MEAILKFDLDDEDKDDNRRFNQAINAPKLSLLLSEIDQELRCIYKYQELGAYSYRGHEIVDIEDLVDRVREHIAEIDIDGI